MEIFGYSERGAMNALFYGMAFSKNGDDLMKKFLGRSDESIEFKLYNEFSLSEFGSPDFVIIAHYKEAYKDKYDAYFIEAKASNGTNYNLTTQLDHHIQYLENGRYDNGHASNLFFQIRLKHYFFSQRKTIIQQGGKSINENSKIERTKNGFRKLGQNPIVKKFAEDLEKCEKAYYIAIIPKQDRTIDCYKDFPSDLNIRYVFWEDLNKDDDFKEILSETMKYNKEDNYSQIENIINS